MKKLLWISLALFSNHSYANCNLPLLHDPLATVLSSAPTCPLNVFEVRERITEAGLTLQPTMVANRGRNNPSLGSFSIFEMITSKDIPAGDFFIGHFTGLDSQGYLTLDQDTGLNSLMIEAFAWDTQKQAYNFYELRGNGKTGVWFYRGDSFDIYADVALLHRQPDPSHPHFGNRLRCSGCHIAGGPIMKELAGPHNDWWTKERGLDFGGHPLDSRLRAIVDKLVSPKVLADGVVAGVKKLRPDRTWQEQLRPLFCPVELNMESDLFPNGYEKKLIQIPVGFFIDTRLAPNKDIKIFINRSDYLEALKASGSHFPETSEIDGDHAWLTPVKATSDQIAIEQLLQNNFITKKFLYAVLFTDFAHPQFSQQRCELLNLLPKQYSTNWLAEFISNLQQSSLPQASTLAHYLTNDKFDENYFKDQAGRYIQYASTNAKFIVPELYRLLIERRQAIKDSEISKNPRGQILEPGFRVIFPETDKYKEKQ